MTAHAGSAGRDATGFHRLRRILRDRSPRRVPQLYTGRSAAVALILAPPAAGRGEEAPAAGALAGARGGGAHRRGLPEPWPAQRLLLIQRAEARDDPWSGHAALPGGRRAPGDLDLVDTARRETREETGLHLDRPDVLGRLDDLRPRSPHLPSITITPFVARWRGDLEIRPNHEVQEHAWVPLGELVDPIRHGTLRVEREDASRDFPTVEVAGLTVWGLTHAILREFLAVLRELPGTEPDTDTGPENPGAKEHGPEERAR